MENATTGENLTPQVKTSANYSDVTLTDAERDEALRLARKDKFHKDKSREYLRSLNQEIKTVKMDKKGYREFVLSEHPEFNPDLQKNQFEFLLDYFTGYLEKGLILFGGVGCGKTTMMKLFTANPKASYGVKACREISSSFTKHGYESIAPFYGKQRSYKNYFNHSEYGICFDDMGEEKNKKYFGNEVNVMEDILETRYNNKNLWALTHITTNLDSQQIEEIYGSRVRSRMREMFELVSFKDINDLRK